MTTHSERVFERICRSERYVVEYLPTKHAEAIRTADFRITLDAHSFIAEVKELAPNKDDRRQILEFKARGITSGGGKVGSRARIHIQDAAGQLKPHVEEGVPLVVVLYDNTRKIEGAPPFPMRNLMTYHIDAAMYGYGVVHVPLKSGARTRPDCYGRERTLAPDRKTYISAVAVISDYDDATLIFYHNHFAARPLQKVFFDGPKYHHLKKASEGSPWDWTLRNA